jgi:hypothetical protein
MEQGGQAQVPALAAHERVEGCTDGLQAERQGGNQAPGELHL